MPTAIDKKIKFKLKKNNTKNNCTVYSENYDVGFSIDLKDIKKSNIEWENYILGVLYEMQNLTDRIEGFDCALKTLVKNKLAGY